MTHTPTCLAAAIICAVENVRDFQIEHPEADWIKAFGCRGIEDIGLDYLEDGTKSCICPVDPEVVTFDCQRCGETITTDVDLFQAPGSLSLDWGYEETLCEGCESVLIKKEAKILQHEDDTIWADQVHASRIKNGTHHEATACPECGRIDHRGLTLGLA